MTSAAKKFAEKLKPKSSKSVLAPYREDLLELMQLGYRQAQLLEFLTNQGVQTTQQNLSWFLNSIVKKQKQEPPKSSIAKQPEPKSQAQVPQVPAPELSKEEKIAQLRTALNKPRKDITQ